MKKCKHCNSCLTQVMINNSFYVFFCDFCNRWFDFNNHEYTKEEMNVLLQRNVNKVNENIIPTKKEN